MREMCNDFLVESETAVIVEPSTTAASPTRCGQNRCNQNCPAVDDNMGVISCNDCVLQAIGLAQAFVPFQPNAVTMDKEQSLVCGTAFPDLVQPYVKGSNLKPRTE